ncbi:MAG: hypothetical protein JNM56_25830 [Planctomycetia bacterium]|nr:hypothetical protein [Planctomycetia bacterium]
MKPRTVLASVGVWSLALVCTVQARIAAPMPLPLRLANADCVVVGKVVSIEDKTVAAPLERGGDQKVEYKIALVKIDEGLFGAKGLTHVRVGFLPGNAQVGRSRFEHMYHAVGQEACFILTKHFADPSFLVAPAYSLVIPKGDKAGTNFDEEMKRVRRCTQVLNDPDAALKAPTAGDRFLAAALLIARYRNADRGTKTEAIPAEQSKRILAALAEADWTQRDPQTQLTPHQVFAMLNLQAADGWNPPVFKDVLKEFPVAAQKWLKDHPDFRIQRYLPDAAQR